MKSAACLVPALLAVSAACVPIETVELPSDVDWVAWVSDPPEAPIQLEPRPNEPLNIDPQQPQWLLGFSNDALQITGESGGVANPPQLRLTKPCETSALEPTWSFGIQQSEPPPSVLLASQPPQRCEPLTRDSFVIRSFEIDQTVDARWLAFGMTSHGTPLLTIDDRKLYELGPEGPTDLGRFHETFYVFSVLKHESGYSVVASSELYTGLVPERLTKVNVGVLTPGRLYWSQKFGPLYIPTDGNPPVRLASLDANTETGSYSLFPPFLDVAEDSDGNILATGPSRDGPDWSWRWNGENQERNIGLTQPIASVNGRTVFGLETGAILAPLRGNPTETNVIADVRSVRSSDYYAPILDLVAYQDGLVAGDSLGYLTWVDLDGQLAELAHIILEPKKMFIVGDDIIVVAKDVNAQFFYTDLRTNISIYVLSLKQ